MKKPTKAQQWARKRNWQKGQLISLRHLLSNPIYTTKENKYLNLIRQYVNELLADWNNNNKESKSNYLKG